MHHTRYFTIYGVLLSLVGINLVRVGDHSLDLAPARFAALAGGKVQHMKGSRNQAQHTYCVLGRGLSEAAPSTPHRSELRSLPNLSWHRASFQSIMELATQHAAIITVHGAH